MRRMSRAYWADDDDGLSRRSAPIARAARLAPAVAPQREAAATGVGARAVPRAVAEGGELHRNVGGAAEAHQKDTSVQHRIVSGPHVDVGDGSISADWLGARADRQHRGKERAGWI